jgi:hypothetical protein
LPELSLEPGLLLESGFSGERAWGVTAGRPLDAAAGAGSARGSRLVSGWRGSEPWSGWPGKSKETFFTEDEERRLRDSFAVSDFFGSCGSVWLKGSSFAFLREESDLDVARSASDASMSGTAFLSEPFSVGTSTRGAACAWASVLPVSGFFGCEAGRLVEKSL